MPSARILLLKELASADGSVRVTGELVEERGARLVLQAATYSVILYRIMYSLIYNIYDIILYIIILFHR